MTRKLFVAVTVGLALTSLVLASSGNPGGYTVMASQYETIRQALLHDSTEGVAVQALKIAEAARTLHHDFDAAAAAVPEDRASKSLELLPEIQATAAALASAGSIEEAREAFGDLSKVMVDYRQLLSKPESVVAFCSMAQQTWLQPKGEIGNPYYGQSMARCGEVISE